MKQPPLQLHLSMNTQSYRDVITHTFQMTSAKGKKLENQYFPNININTFCSSSGYGYIKVLIPINRFYLDSFVFKTLNQDS